MQTENELNYNKLFFSPTNGIRYFMKVIFEFLIYLTLNILKLFFKYYEDYTSIFLYYKQHFFHFFFCHLCLKNHNHIVDIINYQVNDFL